MGKQLSQRKQQSQLTHRLRQQGLTWTEIAEVLQRRHGVNARAALRLARGWSQADAAAAWNRQWPDDPKTAKNFSYWETWPISGHAPSLGTLDRLARLYECSVSELLADLSDYRSHDEATPTELDDVRRVWDRSIGRRNFLTGVGAGLVVTLTGTALSGSGSTLRKGVDDGIAAHAAVTASYWRLEGTFGPSTVYSQALDHYRVLNDWLTQTRDRALWRQVADLTANAAVLLSWLHFDLEHYDQAALVYRNTLDLADELEDGDLRAFVVGRMSRTLSECARHEEALTLANHAERHARSGARPATRSWLAATRAYVHACVGDENASRADLDAAFALLDDDSGEALPTYIDYYGQPNLRKWAGHTMLRLANSRSASAQEARCTIEQALAIWPASGVRESGEVLAAAASARLAEREVDEAVRLTKDAYDVAIRTGSPRVLRHVAHVRQQLTTCGHPRALWELDDHLLVHR
jgi:transcriptional regulator with XRE-family HTH domain